MPEPPLWALRVATDPRFGAGHVARCAALAAALPGHVEIFIDSVGRVPESLATFPCSSEASAVHADLLLDVVRAGRAAAIFDSPAIREPDIAWAAARTWTVAFRDGSPYGPEHLSVDLSPAAKTRAGILGGPTWAPLARGLAAAHETARRGACDDSAAPRVLVAFGARDSVNRTALALEAVARLGLAATAALGPAFQYRDAIEALRAKSPAIDIAVDSSDMTGLYLSHELAVGAPGVSQFERACCGVPTVLVPQDEKQAPLAAAWAALGCAVAAHQSHDGIAGALDELVRNRGKRQAMRAAALAAVDGRGAERLAAALAARVGAVIAT